MLVTGNASVSNSSGNLFACVQFSGVFRSVSWTCAILSNFSAACPLFVLTLLPSSDTCLLGKSLSLRPQQRVSYWGVSLGRSGRAFINGSLGWSTYLQ